MQQVRRSIHRLLTLRKVPPAAITTALPSPSPWELGIQPGKDNLEKKGRSGVFLAAFSADSIHPVSKWGIMPSKGARINTSSVGCKLGRERKHSTWTSPGVGDQARSPGCGAEGGGPPFQRGEEHVDDAGYCPCSQGSSSMSKQEILVRGLNRSLDYLSLSTGCYMKGKHAHESLTMNSGEYTQST